MEQTTEETTDSEKRFCTRYNDHSGLNTKLYKRKFRNKTERERYHYCIKHVEKVARGCSPTSLAKRKEFRKFQRFSEGLKLKAMPEGYYSSSVKEKKKTVKKLAEELDDELAAAMSHGPVQDVGMQVINPDQIQADEVRAAAPNPDSGNTVSNDASLQNVAWNQSDNSQGQPPSRPPVSLEEIVSYINYLKQSRFPGSLTKFEWSEEARWSFGNQLELVEGALRDRSSLHLRSCEEDFFPPIPDLSAHEGEANLPSMETLSDEKWGNTYASPGRPEAPGTSPNVFTG